MDKNDVSYFALEGIMTHFSNIIKRLVITILVIVILWAATLAGFIWYLSLPVDEVTSVEVDNKDGNATYVGNDMMGDFNYGESKEN